MKNKENLFADLCKEVQKCTVCKNVMFSPHFEQSNCFVHVENKEKKNVLIFGIIGKEALTQKLW